MSRRRVAAGLVYDGAVLAIGSGRGFGAYMPYQLSLFGQTGRHAVAGG